MDILELLNKNEKKDLRVNKLFLKDDYVKVNLLSDDNKYVLSLSIDDYYETKLKKGDYLSFEKYEELKNSENVLLAYRSAIKRIGMKDYSIKSLSNSLKDKYQLSDKDLNELIDKLKKLDYLNDERYTKYRINSLLDQGNSKRMIYQKLTKEGISSYLIDKYYPLDNNLELDNIKRKADKYLKTIHNKSLNAKKQAIYTKLIALGFNSQTVKEVVEGLNFSEDKKLEDMKLDKEFDKAVAKYQKKYEKYELKNKIYTYLMSKGFNSEDIGKKMNAKGY